MVSADTITAIATAKGPAGIGVVRVSGPSVPLMIPALVGKTLKPRDAAFVRFRERSGELIDEGVALYFAAPHSYTGEDVLELQGHGGVAVLACLLRRSMEEGARLAEPGEFTKRAFLNGKIDLLQADAVADLIAASSERAVRSAARSMSGVLSQHIERIQTDLMDLRVVLEGSIDFPDEGIDFLRQDDVPNRLSQLEQALRKLLAAARTGKCLQEGVRLAIVGPPNVGKSSLLNALCRDDVAIVTAIPGTTRDLVRESIQLDGLPLHLVDTAGIRETSDLIEQAGIERSQRASRDADIILLVSEAMLRAVPDDQLIAHHGSARSIYVHNKIDLFGEQARVERSGEETHVWLSAKSGNGLELLEAVIVAAAGAADSVEGEFAARQRHIEALERSLDAVRRATEVADQPELAGEELTHAHTALGTIAGAVTSDELLGEIFSRFCIGK
jgi:tRNA modification GTPase